MVAGPATTGSGLIVIVVGGDGPVRRPVRAWIDAGGAGGSERAGGAGTVLRECHDDVIAGVLVASGPTFVALDGLFDARLRAAAYVPPGVAGLLVVDLSGAVPAVLSYPAAGVADSDAMAALLRADRAQRFAAQGRIAEANATLDTGPAGIPGTIVRGLIAARSGAAGADDVVRLVAALNTAAPRLPDAAVLETLGAGAQSAAPRQGPGAAAQPVGVAHAGRHAHARGAALPRRRNRAARDRRRRRRRPAPRAARGGMAQLNVHHTSHRSAGTMSRMGAETVGRHMPPVITLDDVAAMMAADERHRYETSPEGVLSVSPPAGYAHAIIATRLMGWLLAAGVRPIASRRRSASASPASRHRRPHPRPDRLEHDTSRRRMAAGRRCPAGSGDHLTRLRGGGHRHQAHRVRRPGIPQYWTVDQDTQTVTMYRLNGDQYLAARQCRSPGCSTPPPPNTTWADSGSTHVGRPAMSWAGVRVETSWTNDAYTAMSGSLRRIR